MERNHSEVGTMTTPDIFLSYNREDSDTARAGSDA